MASKLVANAFAVFSPIEAENVLLGVYTFVPHYRSGIAASLTQPFTNDLGIRAEITMTIPVKADSGSENAEVKLTVRGPGDVTAIEGEIIRRYPEPGTPNAEPSDLAHIEFDSPDFPWQFTPAGPDSKGNVPPWLRLVVVNAAVAEVTPATANSLAVLTTPKTELPPENEAWAWAHAQVLGDEGVNPSVAQRLSPATPATNLSRLVSPRQLPAYQDWIACLVPTFQAGVEAGLGQDVVTAKLAYSWTGATGEAVLPVYHYWTFSTGPDGDFETLAERLVPVKPSGNVGVRITDTTHPGNGIEPVDAAEPGTRRSIRGALTRPGLNEFDGLSWPQNTTDSVRTQLNAPAAQHFDDSQRADDPKIAPPIYAGVHIARTDITDQPPWFRDVNLDPADRVVAGLGTRVVQMDQEQLMASAWAQVAGVEETNRALRAAQLGRYVSESMHRRHLKRLHASDLLAVTDRATARLLDTPNQTVRTKVDNSVLPTAVTSGITRRLLAPRGRYTRFAVEEGVSPRQSRVDAVRRLLTADDNATSWVRTYSDPDGVTALAAATAELLNLADPPETINDGLAEDGLIERLIAAADASKLEDVLAQMADPVREIPLAMLNRLLFILPTAAEINADPSVAEAVPSIVAQLLAVMNFLSAHPQQVGDWTLTDETASRIRHPSPILSREILRMLQTVARQCEELRIPVPFEPDPRIRDTLDEAVEGANPETLVDGFAGIAGIAVHPGGIRDINRNGFGVDDLGLVGKLEPKTTINRRVLARLPAKSAWPLWLPKDWFDNGRVDQVMAAPNFPHPLYEALDRYDREWLMPGVAALKPHEMVTLLSTNARFVEAFLVGANHEFARELIWRGYPSDGRGTSFRSFWTPAVELLKPVHAFGGGNLGSHIDPKRAGRIVLLVRGELVRRYPNVLADIVTQPADAEYPDKFSKQSAAEQLFRLHLDPDMLLVGFDITYEGIAAKTPKKAGAMWFTLSEHVGEPRFGLDETSAVVAPAPPPPPAVRWRDDLRWADMVTNDRKFLLAAAPRVPVERTFHPDSGHFAWLLFQQPARVAYAGLDMMNKIH